MITLDQHGIDERTAAQPPSDITAERCVIGAMFANPVACDAVTAIVKAADFYDNANQIVFHAATMIYADTGTIDATILLAHLRQTGEYDAVGGSTFLMDLLRSPPDAANVEHYARVVADRARLRRLILMCSEATSAAYSESPSDEVAQSLAASLELLAADSVGGSECVGLESATHELLDLLDNPSQSKLGTLVATGVECLDETYGGFRSGGSYVVAARPGCGKSALAKQIASAMDLRGKPVLFVSLEMEPHEIAARVISERSGIDGKKFEIDESGECLLNHDDRSKIIEAGNTTTESVMHIAAPTGRRSTMEAIAAHARLMTARHGIKLLVIDYLQLIAKSSPRQSDYEAVTANSKACKRLARELGIVVLTLAQLNRDSEKQQKAPRRPRLSDLRDSGSIEQDADGVIALHRKEDGCDDFELLVLKWRNDSPGVFDVRLVGELTKFAPPRIQDHANYRPEFGEWN